MAKKYDLDFLKKISQKLESIPDYSSTNYGDEKTLVESVDILRPVIMDLSRKGYKASLISEMLIQEGMDANQQYLQKLVQKILVLNKKTKIKSIKQNVKKSDSKTSFTVNEDTEQL